MKIRTIAATLFIMAIFFGCTNQKSSQMSQFKAIDPSNMDTTVKPGDNFFLYANGNWMKKNPIPDEYSRWGSFNVLEDENNNRLKTILEAAEKNTNAPKGSIEQQLGSLYASGMDSIKINQLGIQPIQPLLDKINSIKTLADLQDAIAYLHSYEIFPVFYLFSSPDEKNSNMVITQLCQGGLGMGNRDYYTLNDAQSQNLRTKYVEYISKMYEISKENPNPTTVSKAIMDMETKIANNSMTLLEQRNPQNVYHKMSLADLQKLTPNFDWIKYFATVGLPNPGDINVAQPEFFKAFNKMLKDQPLDTWKEYLKWNVMNSLSPYLSDEYVNQHFEFYGKTFSGSKKLLPRWKRVLGLINGEMGEALGQLYVKQYFPPEAKQKMIVLVGNLKAAFHDRIQKLDWMSDSTKQKAIEKLAAMNVKVGYPDKWRDFSKLEITRDNYIQNILNANKFDMEYTLSKIGKAPDRTEWGMTPQTVNAYYSPNMNEIVFPAGILQPPFFSKDADDAVNYGGIGGVIGHEMTHGFDDQGRQYDKNGNLSEWWTKEDAEKFTAKTKALIDEYNNYVELDTFHINGALTLGENIADLGGITISYDALQRAWKQNPPKDKIDGFTPTQRYLLSWAQVWRQNIRPEELKKRLKDDVHSPGDARVNVVISNLDIFYDAFNVKPENKLYRAPENRVKIW